MIAATSGPARPAGFFVRAIAYLLDALLLSLVGGAFPYLVISTGNTANSSSGSAGGGAGAASVFVSLVYFVLFWSFLGGGRTLGMRVMGLRVVHEDGRRIEILDAIVRWIGLWISFAACFVGVVWVTFDGRHRGWHDMMARTLVVHA